MTKIYLISPPKIEIDNFSEQLEIALKTGKVPVFQLRIKGYQDEDVIEIGKKILQICHQYKTFFILNDRLDLALKIAADGVHLGGNDGDILLARKNSPENFIIGASCYDSKHITVEAIEAGANYVSFGSFFSSPTKNSKGKPTPEILQWCDEILDAPSVAIGGITAENCADLVRAKADFLAVISYVWNNKNGVEWAVNNLAANIKAAS
ncbi:MAG: thiamine phosphate synthase [Pseudomonadota bacterium]